LTSTGWPREKLKNAYTALGINNLILLEKIGAGDEIRTHDFNLGKLVYYSTRELILLGVLL
jgi:hypothetical protein